MSDERGSAPLKEVALAHRYRWRLLACLFIYTNPMRLPDVAHQLTIWEGRDDESDELRKRLTIYNALYHDHLPVLCEADLVRYHQRNDEVELGSAAERIEAPIRRQFADEIRTLLATEWAAIHVSSACE